MRPRHRHRRGAGLQRLRRRRPRSRRHDRARRACARRMAAPLRRRGGLDGVISVGFLDGRWVTDADTRAARRVRRAGLGGLPQRRRPRRRPARRLARRAHRLPEPRRPSRAGCGPRWPAPSAAPTPFTLVLLDLEDFKSVNERFGHLSGDAVLRAVGEVLRSSVREQDEVARFGGDEFALILPDTAEDESEPLVGRLLEQAATGQRARRRHRSAPTRAWRSGARARARSRVIERADQSLLSVKRDHHADDRRGRGAASGLGRRRPRRARATRGAGAWRRLARGGQAVAPAGGRRGRRRPPPTS